MEYKSLSCLIGKRELVALSVVVCAFAALLVLQWAVWSFVAVALLFVGYASWSTTAFFANQQQFSGHSLTACFWPVGIATVQALIGFGCGWLIVWMARHVIGS